MTSSGPGGGSYLLGIDIGGTFTDIILARHDGVLHKAKVGSTFDPVQGIVRGIEDLLRRYSVEPANVRKVIHATTVATNAILEHKGSRTGLLTTRGFRDVLEIGRLRRPTLFDITWKKPPALVRRQLRLEVEERLDQRGDVIVPLNRDDAVAKIAALRALGVESVAVCLLHSYRNPAHERAIAELFREHWPQACVSLSSEVLPEVREFERTSTTVVNAYIRPVVERYITTLERELARIGMPAPLLIMQSNGGVVDARSACERPVTIIESGPAAGVLAATYLARHADLERFIAFDMGGTTAKATTVERWEPKINPGCEVGAGINASSRLSSSGAGYPVRVPSIDIAEVGSGGGSVAWIDKAGALRLGPMSAGAHPGPACYGKGQRQPTVTDANVVLGYMNPQKLAGGFLRIDQSLAVRAIRDEIAQPLGLAIEEAALGIHRIANASMAKAVRAVTTERGRDPREFDLICFGGSGPVHGAMLALSMSLRKVVVPVAPGLFSAVGLLFADIRHDFLISVSRKLAELSDTWLRGRFGELADRARERLGATGTRVDECVMKWSADLRYAGQTSEITVPSDLESPDVVEQLVRDFMAEYELTYGNNGDAARIELVNLRLGAVSPAYKIGYGDLARSVDQEMGTGAAARRNVYFGGLLGYLDTPVYATRKALAGRTLRGPLIIEEFDTTILVPPECAVELGPNGDVIIHTSSSAYQPEHLTGMRAARHPAAQETSM